MAPNTFDVRIQERRRDLSLLILNLVSPNTIERMKKKQICLRRICSSIGVGRMHTTHTQEAYHVSHPRSVKLAISIQRMKAETLSWTRGFPTARRGFVHKSRQRYKLIHNLQGERQNYFAQWKQNDAIVWNRLQCRETDTAAKGCRGFCDF